MKTQIDNIEARLDERCEREETTARLIEVPQVLMPFADQLTRIEAALMRMEDGGYGYCTCCGGAIKIERLEVDPAVATCIACSKSQTG